MNKYRHNLGGYTPVSKPDALRIMLLTDISETLAMILDELKKEEGNGRLNSED